MLSKSTAQLTTQPADSLVLERLPSGEFAWLRPDLDTAIRDADRLDRDASRLLGETRVALTDLGRRALAMEALFSRPWPTVAEAYALAGVA